MTLKEAHAFLLKQEQAQAQAQDGNPEETEVKLSVPERKKLIAAEIEKLGYESPAPSVSLAKFEEVLAYAKEQSGSEGEQSDTAEML